MAWFKVDDTLALHPKILAAGNAAVGLWARAGAWSMQQLTDGFVPDGVARTLGTPGEAKRLVSVGLWLQVDGGYTFHQWTDVQRTKDQVKADRHAASERQRHARERAKSQRESRRDTSVSHGPPDQTRPDQTRKIEAYASQEPDRFDEFWDTYGKKVDRKGAEKLWAAALKKPGVTPDLLIASAAAYVLYERNNEGGRFVMDPSRWLRNERWRDERPTRAAPQGRVQEHLALVQQLAQRDHVDMPTPFQIGGPA